MYYLEITKDMETTYPVGLTTKFEGHAVKVIGYHLANGWFAVYRIDDREYDGNSYDLEQDLNYIKGELQKLLPSGYSAIWTRD